MPNKKIRGDILKTFNELMDKSIVLKATFDIKKSDEDKRLAFGWASVANFEDGSVLTDADDDIIDIETLEKGWWIGFFVTDETVWEKVKSGEYAMFSIEGRAQRVEVTGE